MASEAAAVAGHCGRRKRLPQSREEEEEEVDMVAAWTCPVARRVAAAAATTKRTVVAGSCQSVFNGVGCSFAPTHKRPARLGCVTADDHI